MAGRPSRLYRRAMADPKRPPRHHLTVAEAQAIAEDVRHGRRERIADVRFPEKFQLQVGTLQGVTFENCSLWLTLGGGMLRGGVMEGCRFVDVDLDPLTIYGSELRDTRFERVAFGVRAMGGMDDTRIDGGSFSDCRMVDFGFRKTRLAGVGIEGGRMDGVRFDMCSFIDISLASAMRDVILLDCAFERSDISSADVVDVNLIDWRAADLRLPGRRTGFFVTPGVVSETLAATPDALTSAFRDRVFTDLVMAGYDLVAVSERFFTAELGAKPSDASTLVDALFPHRLAALGEVRPAARTSRR